MNKVYLACFQNLFSVYKRSKNTWSNLLSTEDVETIENHFKGCGIPYKRSLDFSNIPGIVYEDDEPCSYRVVIQVNDNEYNIYSHDDRCIKRVYAEKFQKAFEAKGIPARIELMGKIRRD